MSVLRYAVEEALSSLWRGRRFSVLAVATIATAVLVLGCFLLATTNLEHLVDQWRSATELSVFLADTATDDDRRQVEAVLAPGALVASVEFVSKAQALVRFKGMFGDLAPTVDALGRNPLPASYEVRLQPAAGDRQAIEQLAARLRSTAGVADVRYDRQWLDRLLAGVAVVRRIGLVLSAILALAAALTVTTVVRLALHARRDELEIMELVGSPSAYVQGPFILEGALQGLIGGGAAVAILAVAFRALRARDLATWAAALNLADVQFLPIWTSVLLVVGATAVGGVSGLLAARTRG